MGVCVRRDSVKGGGVRRESVKRDGVRRDSVRRDGAKGNSVRREGENPMCCTSGRKCPACRLCVTQSKLSTQHWPAMPWKYFSVRSHTRLSASETQHQAPQKSETRMTASVSVS